MIWMGNDMPVAELLGNMSLETLISIGGLIFLVVVLTALQVSSRRNQREMEQARTEREMRERIDALMGKLDGGSRSVSSARLRPIRRTADRYVPAARCGKPFGRENGYSRR